MEDLLEVLGTVDRPHLPPPGTANAASFKEWYHFNLLAPGDGTDIILNLSLDGDVNRVGGGDADLILLVHRAGEGWRGAIDSYEAAAVDLDERQLDMRLGGNVIRYADGRYRLSARLRDGSAGLEAELRPATKPMMVWNDTPLGSGHLNWLILPHLEADGRLLLDGRAVALDGICAYHDHNWGFWRWGEDFGWEWGFASDMGRPLGEGRDTLVFDRTTDRLGSTVMEQTLALWRDAELVKLFTRRMLRTERRGTFRGRIPRVPGAMNLLAQGAVLAVPAELRISARDGADWLDIAYRVEAALQVTIPGELGFGTVGLNETVGSLQAAGRVAGERVAFAARACFEFLG